MLKRIHIVCFDRPNPPDYGGAIDMFFKISELSAAGVYVVLHIFTYGSRNANDEALREMVGEIHYYKRHTGILSNLSYLPYIVYSRKNKDLLKHLLMDDNPILFEGLHSCYYLSHPLLRNRIKLVRIHNIEHHYYRYLARDTSKVWKKIYFVLESFRLRFFQPRLRRASVLYAISSADREYLQKRFLNLTVELMPCFVQQNEIRSVTSLVDVRVPYVLYHGNLSVSENHRVAQYLIDFVKPLINKNICFVIAGKNPLPTLVHKINETENAKLIVSPSDDELHSLLINAHVNVLLTFQPTGIKLKLLNALYYGGHCVVNKLMLSGTGLDSLCERAEKPLDIAKAINKLMVTEFTPAMKADRIQKLSELYSNNKNLKVLLKYL